MKAITIAAAAFVVGAALASILLHQAGENSAARSAGRTYGQILVDSPEVYTRERMVNDRFRQEAWLLEALNRDSTPTIQGALETTRSQVFTGTFVGNAPGQTQSPAPSLGSHDSDRSAGGGSASSGSTQPQLSKIEAFRSRQAYREEIRNAIIENQLDDRHDLLGNTLYRLKFDATVVPDGDTSAWARVIVRFENRRAGAPEELQFVYDRWIVAVGEFVNERAREQTEKEKATPKLRYASLRRYAQEFLGLFPDKDQSTLR